MITTLFTFVFAFACLATFLCGIRKEWSGARLPLALIAILSFLIARNDRRKLTMTAWAKFDGCTLRLPRRPPVSTRSRRTIDAHATQASAVNLLALGNGKA
jgi:hypothetical protein